MRVICKSRLRVGAMLKHPVHQPFLRGGGPVMLLLPPAEHLRMALAAVAGEAGWRQVGAYGAATTGAGPDVVQALRRVAAVCAAVAPCLEDALPERAPRDELGAFDPCLHVLRSVAIGYR